MYTKILPNLAKDPDIASKWFGAVWNLVLGPTLHLVVVCIAFLTLDREASAHRAVTILSFFTGFDRAEPPPTHSNSPLPQVV